MKAPLLPRVLVLSSLVMLVNLPVQAQEQSSGTEPYYEGSPSSAAPSTASPSPGFANEIPPNAQTAASPQAPKALEKGLDPLDFLRLDYLLLACCLLLMALVAWLFAKVAGLSTQLAALQNQAGKQKSYTDSALHHLYTQRIQPLETELPKLRRNLLQLQDRSAYQQAGPPASAPAYSDSGADYSGFNRAYSEPVPPAGPDPHDILSAFLQNAPAALDTYPNVKLKAERANQQARRNDPQAPLELEDAGGASQAFYYGFELANQEYVVVPGLQHTYNDSLLQIQGLDRIYEIITLADKHKGKVQTIDIPAIMKRESAGLSLVQKGRLTLSV